jgi:hypothetical protein
MAEIQLSVDARSCCHGRRHLAQLAIPGGQAIADRPRPLNP